MQPLPMPEKIEGVLSFDFDGTLLDPKSDPQIEPRFFELIKELRAKGWVWGINTGRSQMQTVAGFNEGAFPFLPDFLVARERELYTPGQFGRWIPVAEWNKRSDKDHKKMFRKAKRVLKKVREFVETQTESKWVEEEGDPAGAIAKSEEEMQTIIDFVEEHSASCDTLAYQRNSIYMRFSHKAYHKGTSLEEIAKRCGVDKDKVFTIGDGHNDLDMLNTEFAEMLACPANSPEDIKEHVRQQGGYICKQPSSLGVIEALTHFLC